jgi:hypothetical protein
MSAHRTVPIELGNVTYNLRFGAIGAFLLQQVTGESITHFASKVDANQLGFLELHALMYACLESARRKDHVHPTPWTLDSVGDLIDEQCDGDLVEFWKHYHGPMVQAFRNSFHVSMKQQAELLRQQEAAKRKEAGPEDPTIAAETLTGDFPATGTTVLTSPPRPGSRQKRSGR